MTKRKNTDPRNRKTDSGFPNFVPEVWGFPEPSNSTDPNFKKKTIKSPTEKSPPREEVIPLYVAYLYSCRCRFYPQVEPERLSATKSITIFNRKIDDLLVYYSMLAQADLLSLNLDIKTLPEDWFVLEIESP